MHFAPVLQQGALTSEPSTPHAIKSSSKAQFFKSPTASELLATFSPKSQTKKGPCIWGSPSTYPITMTSKRELRQKPRISYGISDDSESEQSPFSTPQSSPIKTTVRHTDSVGTLLKAQVPKQATRQELKGLIETETAEKRAKFFISKKDYFLPLLPQDNHIQRLEEERLQSQTRAGDLSVPYEALKEQPNGVKATMKSYQLAGLSYLLYLNKNGLSGILGDEMGLGKTLQTLSLIQYLKENRKSALSIAECRPCLVVCPLSVLSSWISEARRWTPKLKVLRFHGPVRERQRLKKISTGEENGYGTKTNSVRQGKGQRSQVKTKADVKDSVVDADINTEEGGVDLIVTTYEGFFAEQSWFKRAFFWHYVILDEGHKIKNDLSQIAKSLQGLVAEYRLILTGTPLQNNLTELWALLHWLYPEVFTDKTADLFKKSFDLSRGQVSTKVMDDARSLLELIMLRRMKNSPGVNLGLPPKTEILLYVPLTPMQKFWYTRLLTRADQGLLETLFQDAKTKEPSAHKEETFIQIEGQDDDLTEPAGTQMKCKSSPSTGTEWEESKNILERAIQQEKRDGSKMAWKKLMNLLMQLRKCCNHPYLLPHAEPNPYHIGEHIIHASAKFILLDKLISELVIRQNKKILIFSGFTKALDCCEDLLYLRGGDGKRFQYARLDGSKVRARRNLAIRMFNEENSSYRVMLISTRAGGLGINLTSASDVIMLDQDWNPQIMLQAEARAHRIGQTKPVTVYKLCTQGTVEEQMMGRIQKKLYLSAKITENIRDIHAPASAKSRRKGSNSDINTKVDEDMPQLDTTQLMSLVRRGAQALVHPELDITEMLGWDWPTMLEKCKNKPADLQNSKQTFTNNSSREEDEKKWLSQMEQVESRIFQGKRYGKNKEKETYNDIRQEWARKERRKGKNTTVMVDGYAVSKESMLCGDWEAVPTLAGKDPRLAEPKREKKAAIINQEHCQVCSDGGELILCSGCPRSYHYQCLDSDFKRRSRGWNTFSCPQHQCFDCQQKTSDAGGMIYRCRWCERGYCEDCLDWGNTKLLGENLEEFELLGFPSVSQAFFIYCQSCNEHHRENLEAFEYCQNMADDIHVRHTRMMDGQELFSAATEIADKSVSRAGSLTDAPTLDDSGISTPQYKESGYVSSDSRKRKAVPERGQDKSDKRPKRTTI